MNFVANRDAATVPHGSDALQGPTPIPAPAPAAPSLDAEAYGRIRNYFTLQLDREVSRATALRMSSKRRQRILRWSGAGLLVAAVAASAAGWLDYAFFRGLEPYEIAAFCVALAFFLIAALLEPHEPIPDASIVEKEASAARQSGVEKRMEGAAKLLALSNETAPKFDAQLVSLPDVNRAKDRKLLVAARIGSDGEARFTPATVTALKFEPDSLAIYQGTFDLTAEHGLAYERLIELPYRDIVALERSSEGVPVSPEVEQQPRLLEHMRRPRQRAARRDKDTLVIRYVGDQSISIVLRDTSFLAPGKDGKLPFAEKQEDVERFWQALRARWFQAQARKV
jgi:hypothetical protein